MNWTPGDIDGVVVHPLKKFSDDRGWLAELFRSDEIDPESMPAMGYISVTRPGQQRGPHEHVDQTDRFGFSGPGNFRVKLWDNRPDSPTYGNTMSLDLGEENPTVLTVPPRVIHGYASLSETNAWVVNFPDRLFAGKGRKDPVDEIRHEDSEDSAVSMD